MECSTLISILAVIVAALSALVVFLLGWQFFQVSRIKKKLKDGLEKSIGDYDNKNKEQIRAVSDFHFTLLNRHIAKMNQDLSIVMLRGRDFGMCIRFGMACISALSNAYDKEKASSKIQDMATVVCKIDFDKAVLVPEDIDEMLRIIYQLERDGFCSNLLAEIKIKILSCSTLA